MNMHNIYALIITFALCPLLTPKLMAQAEGEQTEQQPEQQSSADKKGAKFTCLYWEGTPSENLYYRSGEDFMQLEFNKAIRSKNFPLKKMAVFELYRDAANPKDDQPPYELITKATIPSGTSQVLFLVIPFKNEKGITYRVVAMDDSLKAFPRGTFRFANFTSQMLLVKFAGKVEKLPASKMTVMSCNPGEAGGFRPFIIGNAKGKQVFGTKLFGQASGRELVFISPPERRGSDSPRVKFISQLIGKPLAEAGQ